MAELKVIYSLAPLLTCDEIPLLLALLELLDTLTQHGMLERSTQAYTQFRTMGHTLLR